MFKKLKELEYALSGCDTKIKIVYANGKRKIIPNTTYFTDKELNTTVLNIFTYIYKECNKPESGFEIYLTKLGD